MSWKRNATPCSVAAGSCCFHSREMMSHSSVRFSGEKGSLAVPTSQKHIAAGDARQTICMIGEPFPVFLVLPVDVRKCHTQLPQAVLCSSSRWNTRSSSSSRRTTRRLCSVAIALLVSCHQCGGRTEGWREGTRCCLEVATDMCLASLYSLRVFVTTNRSFGVCVCVLYVCVCVRLRNMKSCKCVKRR